MDTQNATELASVSETFRDRISRSLSDRRPLVSSFEIVANAIASGAVEEARPCDDCDGLGFRSLPEPRRATWQARIADERTQAALQVRELEEQARADKTIPDWKQIASIRLSAGEREKRLRYECNRESVCHSCQGTGYVHGETRAPLVPHDSVWTTVACPYCRGQNVSRVDGSRKNGTSCGESMARDDAAAELGDRCPVCLGDAYLVPISARPLASPPDFSGDYVKSIDDLPRARRCFTEQPEPDGEPDDAEQFMRELEETDPLLAAAVAVLYGPRGDEWRGHNWGRAFALWPLTEAGQKLTEGKVGQDLPAGDTYALFIETIAEIRAESVQAERPDYRLLALISQADDQARRLERRAEQAVRKAEAA